MPLEFLSFLSVSYYFSEFILFLVPLTSIRSLISHCLKGVVRLLRDITSMGSNLLQIFSIFHLNISSSSIHLIDNLIESLFLGIFLIKFSKSIVRYLLLVYWNIWFYFFRLFSILLFISSKLFRAFALLIIFLIHPLSRLRVFLIRIKIFHSRLLWLDIFRIKIVSWYNLWLFVMLSR